MRYEIGTQYVIEAHQTDIKLLSRDGKALGRPWITWLFDAYSRQILGFRISVHPEPIEVFQDYLNREVKKSDERDNNIPRVKRPHAIAVAASDTTLQRAPYRRWNRRR